jgi:hypothetical protein
VPENQFDGVEFTDKNERKKLDNLEPHDATIIRRGGPASPPPCRRDIIFALEMV